MLLVNGKICPTILTFGGFTMNMVLYVMIIRGTLAQVSYLVSAFEGTEVLCHLTL